MTLTDNIHQEKSIMGEVAVKPFDRHGRSLEDPFSIFAHKPKEIKQISQDGYINLADNLVVNLGRQTIANLIGGKDYPNDSWLVGQVSWGTGEEVPRFTDSSISPQVVNGETVGGENEILYDGNLKKKPVSSVDFPSPFMVRFEATLGADEGVGYLIREMALWTNNNTLFARKVFPAISKSGDFALSFLWKLRC